jgi:hypothetical protein
MARRHKLNTLVDFSQCLDSERNGSYAGNAGSKRGISYMGQNWIVKYPKTTRSMHGKKLPSYTSSPLSEYLGSHVYEMLGVDTNRTLLGYDRGKVVVACLDFRPDNGILKEFRALKNAMTPELNERFDMEIAESATGDRVNIEENLFHLKNNPVLAIPGIRERFTDMIAIDAIIDNNDRNNGNWGVLTVGGTSMLAPIFDNGNAFSSKVDDEHLDDDPESIAAKWPGGRSIYESGGHQLSNKNLFAAEIPHLRESVEQAVRRYRTRRQDIADLVMGVPNTYGDIVVCSERRKRAYLAGMDARAQWLADDFGIK